MNNRIYFFTGTGNSLKVAKDIASALPECEIVAVCKDMNVEIPTGYERIGFVFPSYFGGVPDMVVDFIRNAHFTKESAKYYFAITTPGGFAGNPIVQTRNLFSEKGLHLNYGGKVTMNANYVILYDMSNFLLRSALKAYDKRVNIVIQDIKNLKTNDGPDMNKFRERGYMKAIGSVHESDYNYNVNNECISCGICQNVCPAGNITLCDGRPVFHHQCQCCMACIQHCPKKSITYKNKTQKRKRYTHPDIGHAEISKYYVSAKSQSVRLHEEER
jgi:ferredoxin/flavodoxin